MLLEGQVFDNTYRLTRLIGEGGMGAVYEATHARLAGRYAIKVLLRRLSDDPEALARFHREARITSLLQHPNVVEVIDYNTAADGTEYLVMEYLAGESLADRLFREGSLPLDTVVGIIDQIAAGLAAAHAHGIVHRDLKPENVFLVPVEGRESESVKILDFGISKVKGASWGLQAPEGTLCGTPQYMSPEQVENRVADVNAATDQFALAVLAYEMLAGRNPFQDDTMGAVFSRVLNGVPAPTGVGQDVDRVLRRGLAKANRRRFPSVTDFAGALRTAAAHTTHESQRLATITYATGEISALKAKARGRRSSWGLTVGATILASLSMSFVAGGTAKHHSSPAGTPSAAPAVLPAVPFPRGADPRLARPAPPVTQAQPRDAIAVSVSRETADVTTETLRSEIRPTVETRPPPAITRSSTGATAGRPDRFGNTSTAPNSRVRPARPTVRLPPLDDDATLPMDDALVNSQ